MRPIDADALKYRRKEYGGYDDVPMDERRKGILYLFKEDIDEALTIEPKHGKWIKMSDADGVYWVCSECGEDIPRISHYNPQFDLFPRLESIDKTNYCPNCGAPMDLE